jgi:hypothetical protein
MLYFGTSAIFVLLPVNMTGSFIEGKLGFGRRFSAIRHAQEGTYACVPNPPHSGVQARMMKMIARNELHEL